MVQTEGVGLKAYTISIWGQPIPKHRPRFARIGKFVKTYSDQSKDEKCVKKIIESQWPGPPTTGGVRLLVRFCMEIPKSVPKKKRESLTVHTKRPDLDNLIKWVKDCCNGVVWVDDNQVWAMSAVKVYSEKPITEITIIMQEDDPCQISR